MKAPYETWPDPTAPLEGPKLEHGAIGKDDNGSAYRYNDSSPNLLHHGNRKELYWHQSGSTTLFIWLWLMFCVFCVRTMHMHADWVQCITHVTSTSGWITEYIYRIPCQRIGRPSVSTSHLAPQKVLASASPFIWWAIHFDHSVSLSSGLGRLIWWASPPGTFQI